MAITLDVLADQAQTYEQQGDDISLVWSGPEPTPGSLTRDHAVLVKELVHSAQNRLLLATYALYPASHVIELLAIARQKLITIPGFQLRLVVNISREHQITRTHSAILQSFCRETWPRLWPEPPWPQLYYDPRALLPSSKGLMHVKAVLVDHSQALITSANLTEAALLNNYELGVLLGKESRVEQLWKHFDRLIESGLIQLLPLY